AADAVSEEAVLVAVGVGRKDVAETRGYADAGHPGFAFVVRPLPLGFEGFDFREVGETPVVRDGLDRPPKLGHEHARSFGIGSGIRNDRDARRQREAPGRDSERIPVLDGPVVQAFGGRLIFGKALRCAGAEAQNPGNRPYEESGTRARRARAESKEWEHL